VYTLSLVALGGYFIYIGIGQVVQTVAELRHWDEKECRKAETAIVACQDAGRTPDTPECAHFCLIVEVAYDDADAEKLASLAISDPCDFAKRCVI
jgi:hypothetical protein